MDISLPTNVKKEEEKDVIGGFAPLPAGIYDAMIQMAYLDESASGAKCIVIKAKIGEKEVSQTTYISNKAGVFTYKDKQTGDLKPLPGYTQMDTFFVAVTGKGINEQTIEEKVVNIYDYAARKDVPQKRQVFMDVVKQPIKVGLQQINEEKTTKESGYTDGTGEFRKYNEFAKWFNADSGLTTQEEQAGVTEPTFIKAWEENFANKVITKNAKNSKAGATTAP